MDNQKVSESVFNQYWKLAVATLTVAQVNEMVQSNRDDARLVEPLLKCLMVLGGDLEINE